MGLLDILLGRSRPVAPDLDRLFALPSAAVTLQAATGFTPTGQGAVCFATVEGAAFEQIHHEVQALLDADAGRDGSPVEMSRDEYGYSWLVSRRSPEALPSLVNDLHAVNSSMEVNGFGPQLLCSLAGFRHEDGRRLGLVYLYKRGTFYPFAPLPGGAQRRDNPLELRVRAALADDLQIERDLGRWFPVWGAPGL
ncbi:PspA-associated protein PspAB [Streptomyces poriticola]|uniref:PspA-associated protein PspAB n=1 Tax=Streptomyces poriticola TaxID=3120506 RepID=UPI002FCE5DC5